MVKSVGKLALIITPLMKMTSKTNPVSAMVKSVFCLKFRELNNPLLYHGVLVILITPQSWIYIFVNHISKQVSYKHENGTDNNNSQ